jgi:glycosyltransferase involved in cell wall biosynthesis
MNNNRVIYFSTVSSFFKSFMTDLIFKSTSIFCEVFIASNFNFNREQSDLIEFGSLINISFSRNPFSIDNRIAFKEISKLFNSSKQFLIHTQTPVASAIVRIANNGKNPLLYSAHGFHFHSKSNLLSWILYFPIEFLLSFKTDILVTTNREDFKLAKRFFHPKRLELIFGVGVDFDRFVNPKKSKQYLQQLGISESSKVLVSVGELNKNKNHSVVIQLLAERPELAKVHYVICGEGNYRNDLVQQIYKLGLSNRVHLLGHRKDIPMILATADLFVFPSKREGFGMALLEAILSDLDFVAFRIRGIVDLVPEKIHSSHLVEAYNKRLMGDMIVDKITHPQPFSHKEHLQWLKQFSMEEVNQKYLNLYESLLTGKDPSHS